MQKKKTEEEIIELSKEYTNWSSRLKVVEEEKP